MYLDWWKSARPLRSKHAGDDARGPWDAWVQRELKEGDYWRVQAESDSNIGATRHRKNTSACDNCSQLDFAASRRENSRGNIDELHGRSSRWRTLQAQNNAGVCRSNIQLNAWRRLQHQDQGTSRVFSPAQDDLQDRTSGWVHKGQNIGKLGASRSNGCQ